MLATPYILLLILALQSILVYGSPKKKLQTSDDNDLGNSALVLSMKSGKFSIPSGRVAAGDNSNINGNDKNNSNGKRQRKYKITKNQSDMEESHVLAARKLSSSKANQDNDRPHHRNHGENNGNTRRSNNNLNINKRRSMIMKTNKKEKTKSGNDKPDSTCRYSKSNWSECNPHTNVRTRTLTLKKGESNCLATRTMQKKCKKACRYERGSWSECKDGQMTRQDKLKISRISPNTDSNCEQLRNKNKKCSKGSKQQKGKSNKERKHNDKAPRLAPQQQS